MRSLVRMGVWALLGAAMILSTGCGWTARDNFLWNRQVVIPATAVHPGE
ncbi:MAG: hypothetical protein WD749_13095 [Phycisphaerales bacterium]